MTAVFSELKEVTPLPFPKVPSTCSAVLLSVLMAEWPLSELAKDLLMREAALTSEPAKFYSSRAVWVAPPVLVMVVGMRGQEK